MADSGNHRDTPMRTRIETLICICIKANCDHHRDTPMRTRIETRDLHFLAFLIAMTQSYSDENKD